MKKYIYILLLILLITSINADKNIQTNTGESGLTIQYPTYDFVKENSEFKLHLHVFNTTNGILMTNETTSCIVHLYNSSGNHILEQDFGFDDNNIDFEIELNASLFQNGLHSYIIHCNTSYNGGFVSGTYTVTRNGLPDNEPNNNIAVIIGLCGVAFILLYFAFNLNNDHFLLKLLLLFFTLYTILIIPTVTTNYYNSHLLFLKLVQWFFRLFITYFVIYLFYHWAKKSEKFGNLISK
jgi:ABC-type uncharacterized transport system fused permease/ATPase subunit